jgi:anaphase-promoting complex subunit 8
MLDNGTSFTDKNSNSNVLSVYHTPYECSLQPLSEEEYNKYQYAKTLFQIRQFHSVQDVLGESKSPKLYFLRLYARYMVKYRFMRENGQLTIFRTEKRKKMN